MSRKQIAIFSLEPLESRYTSLWITHLPKILNDAGFDAFNVNGSSIPDKPTEGAFLDFLATNTWKNEQANYFFDLVRRGAISDDAILLITDFWNPVLNELRYVKDLLGKNWHIVAFAHAGSYDPADFLGRLIKDKSWVEAAEISMFNACDKVVFATEFHVSLFMETYVGRVSTKKILVSGFPMEYMKDRCYSSEKENLIVFPHRLAPEKQPDLFRKLSSMLPEYQFVLCQESRLTKDEYYNIMSRAKVVFSANLQETLGIGQGEAIFSGAYSMVPDRLSYSEMYLRVFKYPSWFQEDDIANKIKEVVENFDQYVPAITAQREIFESEFFCANSLISYLKTI